MSELDVRTIPGYVVHERLETSLTTATYAASRASDGYPVMLEIVTVEPGDAHAAEARAAVDAIASIRHPVIPTIWEVGEADGMPYTISTAVEGRSLAGVLEARRRLPHDETLTICTELADALEILASAGIVHGAISPHAVWINDRDRSPGAPHVALRGFGSAGLLARRIRRAPRGTPPPDALYVAPEQIDGREVGVRVDQYALACMTLHCLTGAPPFQRPTVDALLNAHVAAPPDESTLHAGGLHRRVIDGLHRALAKDPADRFGSSMAFAAAIGGTAHRSWSWMIEETGHGTDGRRADVTTTEIDIRDDVGPVDAVPPPPRTTADDTRRAAVPEGGPLTARMLAEVDWLPGSANRTGPQPPVAPPLRRTGSPSVPSRLARAPWRRWLGVALVVVFATAVGAVLVPTLTTPRRSTSGPGVAQQPAGPSPLEIEATWRSTVADGPVTHLVATDRALVGATDGSVISLRRSSGSPRWQTTVDGLTELSTVGPIVVAATRDGFTALDRDSGAIVWRSTDAGPRVDDFVTGRGRMFAVSTDRPGFTIYGIDPRTGEVGWSVAGRHDGAADRPAALAFDGSARGGRSLYVALADRLYAFDTTTRRVRWDVALPDPQPASLTAVGGAILAVDDRGRLCRFDARDGTLAWSACATLERAGARVSSVQVRNRRVVVASANEIMSVDFTSGRTLWRIVYDQQLQPAIASNATATFIAAPDGTVEAVGQRTGASLWESAPFGDISAMIATEQDVYVTTVDGRLTRLEAAITPDGG